MYSVVDVEKGKCFKFETAAEACEKYDELKTAGKKVFAFDGGQIAFKKEVGSYRLEDSVVEPETKTTSPRTCSLCKKTGHRAPTCPSKMENGSYLAPDALPNQEVLPNTVK